MYKQNLRRERHTVSLNTEHLVFSPKYREKVLGGEVGVRCEEVISGICSDMGIEIIEMAVAEDHVHLFIEYPPKYSQSEIANRIKGHSSRVLRKEFPHLVKWCKNALWAPSCFHGSVGHGSNVVESYVKCQKPRRKKN
jgi:putative transposase